MHDRLFEAWQELRTLPLGGRGHLVDIVLEAREALAKSEGDRDDDGAIATHELRLAAAVGSLSVIAGFSVAIDELEKLARAELDPDGRGDGPATAALRRVVAAFNAEPAGVAELARGWEGSD